MVAFGAEPINRDQVWLEECLEHYQQPADNKGDNDNLYCLSTTASGQPKHPMARGKHRIANDAQPILWRAA
jgi:hypothetical protein